MESGIGSRYRLALHELLSLLTLKSGVGGTALESERIGEGGVCLGKIWVGGDRCLELCCCVCELATLKEETSAVECKVCALAVHGDATKFGSFFALGCSASGVSLTNKDRCESNVGAWLIGEQLYCAV
jgi:hypothetical protein